MTDICDAALHLCRIRATRLDRLGNPLAGPNNVYVSDKPISLAVTPQIEAGQDQTLVGGCDCIIAQYRGYDKLKRFDFELMLGTLEPALVELMLGAPAILDGDGDPIGVNWSSNLTCSDTAQPPIALEGWQDAWEEDHQDPDRPYIHWVWPMTFWQIGDHTLENDFLQPSLAGFSRGNPQWGDGIFGDYPAPIGDLGGFFYTATVPPVAACGYQTVSVT